jgi:hypothetical protein
MPTHFVCLRDLESPGYLEKRDRILRVMGMTLRVGETATA